MSSDPTSSSDSDNLRRSKRKKFCLDVVAAAHGNNQKKSRRDPHGGDDDEYDIDQFGELSVQTDDKEDDSSTIMDDDDDDDDTVSRRRTRRSTAHWQDYQDTDNWVELSGPNKCHKCPCRYESKSSLANHMKMHQGERRKFQCELCDFSSSTLKSLTLHNNVHVRFGVISPKPSPAIPLVNNVSVATIAVAASIHPDPSLNNVINNNNNNNNNNNAPQLVVAEEEPFALDLEVTGDEEMDMDDLDVTPPPILEREDDGPPVLQREISPSPPMVRKSNRPMKPTQKAQKMEQKKERKPRKSLTSPSPALPKLIAYDSEGIDGGGGSLPTSSTASSVTPPPVITKKTNKKVKMEEEKEEENEEEEKKKMKKRCRCPNCPFTTSTITRLNRHSGGHKLQEGFICPAPNCDFMVRKAGFLPKHFILHKGLQLKWPPKFVKRGEKILKKKKKIVMKKKVKKVIIKKKKMEKKKKMVLKPTRMVTVQKKTSGKKRANTMQLVAHAQIKSHKKVQVDDVVYKQCNIEQCDFQTVSLTQLVVHKTKVHGAKSAFPQHPFLCFTCGIRTKTYSALRSHKLTSHLSAPKRFHRTFYLKEIVGDKFFIKHFTASLINGKVEETEGGKGVIPDADESGDESFDSIPSTDVPAETLAAMEKKEIFFCCNMCPYKAPTMNRCQRHYDKHFTSDPFKCKHCTWSSRSKEVIVSHEKLHEKSDEDIKMEEECDEPKMTSSESAASISESNGTSSSTSSDNNSSPVPPEVSSEVAAIPDLNTSLQKWCSTEKSKRPDLDEQFTRKMIDGVKGFQCTDCPYISKYRGDMRSHKKRHDIEQMYRCVQCTYTTNRPVSLKDHLKQHGVVNNSFDGINNRKVVVNQGIPIGMRRGIGKDRVYCCNKCPYVTLAIGCLWRHFRNHRVTARINICSNCSYSSIDQRKMEEHTIIHLALGTNEPMPFVKRVDQKGRPVSSLTDLNSEKMSERKTNNKRKMEKMVAEVMEDEARDKMRMEKKEKEKDKEFKPKPEKKRKTSSEPSPDLDYKGDIHGLTSCSTTQPTRQLSERATRNRINYSLLSKNGSGKPTPSTSSANLEKLGASQTEEPDEPVEVSHFRIRTFLRTEYGDKAATKCPDCPYKTTDADVLEKHRYFHTQKPNARPYSCSDCTFNTYTPTALLQHLKLHSEGVYFDPMMKRMMKHRKGDSIPAGVKGYYCKNCSFKTANHRNFIEHSAYHRHQLVNRINISLKRQPPKEEYQRPKLKHQFVAKNAKYCKKCTFKCVSQSNFIEHLDRHGWNQLYKCYICDYSDNNKSVVDFHQLNHHIVRDQTLTSIHQASKFRLENGQIQKPETEEQKPTPEEFVTKTRGLLKCPSCEYFCHVSSELAFHMSVNHMKEPNARETISYLHMGLIPPKATVTTI